MRCQNKIYPRHIRLDASVGHHIPVFLLSVSHVITATTYFSFETDGAALSLGLQIHFVRFDRCATCGFGNKVAAAQRTWLHKGAQRPWICVYVRNYQCKSYIQGLCIAMTFCDIYNDQTDWEYMGQTIKSAWMCACIIKIDCLGGFRNVCNKLSTHDDWKWYLNTLKEKSAIQTKQPKTRNWVIDKAGIGGVPRRSIAVAA